MPWVSPIASYWTRPSAGVPCDRGPLGVRVMQHGKDYMSDKAGFTTLAQLEEARRVQAETGRIHSICYSERFLNRSTVKAGELVQAGAIGRVLQTVSLGPHLRRFHTRPEWFFQREKYGGIIIDIGSHNFDQFTFSPALPRPRSSRPRSPTIIIRNIPSLRISAT